MPWNVAMVLRFALDCHSLSVMFKKGCKNDLWIPPFQWVDSNLRLDLNGFIVIRRSGYHRPKEKRMCNVHL